MMKENQCLIEIKFLADEAIAPGDGAPCLPSQDTVHDDTENVGSINLFWNGHYLDTKL